MSNVSTVSDFFTLGLYIMGASIANKLGLGEGRGSCRLTTLGGMTSGLGWPRVAVLLLRPEVSSKFWVGSILGSGSGLRGGKISGVAISGGVIVTGCGFSGGVSGGVGCFSPISSRISSTIGISASNESKSDKSSVDEVSDGDVLFVVGLHGACPVVLVDAWKLVNKFLRSC